MTTHRYHAFLSYSSRDGKIAERLHRALETYRTPRRLVGNQGVWGQVPRRIFPIFRDRDEFAASADLGASIREALEESRFLVVLCSRASARSEWVNEEVRQFVAPGREGRVLAVILDGEPGSPDEECFPPALSEAFNSGAEPLAADLREGKDGWSLALMKLRAGLLGVKLDSLIERERRRKRQRWAIGLAGVAALIAVLGSGLNELVVSRAAGRAEALMSRAEEALLEERWAESAALFARGVEEAPGRMDLEPFCAGFDLLTRLRPVQQVVEQVTDLFVFNWRGKTYVKWDGRAARLAEQPAFRFNLVDGGSILVVSDIYGLVRGLDTNTLTELWRTQLSWRAGACSIEDLGDALRIGAMWNDGGVTLGATSFQNVRVDKASLEVSSIEDKVNFAGPGTVICGDDSQDTDPAAAASVGTTGLPRTGELVVELPFPAIAAEKALWVATSEAVGLALRGQQRLRALAQIPPTDPEALEYDPGLESRSLFERYASSYTGGPEQVDRCGESVFTFGITIWGMGGGMVTVCRLGDEPGTEPACDNVVYGIDYLDGAISPRCDLIVLTGRDLEENSGFIALSTNRLGANDPTVFAGTSELPVTEASSVVFSPSAARVAAIGGDGKLYVMRNLDGRLELSNAHDAGSLGDMLDLAYLGEDRLAVLSAQAGQLTLAIVSDAAAVVRTLSVPATLIDSAALLEHSEFDLAENLRMHAHWDVALRATADGRFLALVTRLGAQLYAVERGLPLGRPFLFESYPTYGESERGDAWSRRVDDQVDLGLSGDSIVLSIGDLAYSRPVPGLDEARALLPRIHERTGIDGSDGVTPLRELPSRSAETENVQGSGK